MEEETINKPESNTENYGQMIILKDNASANIIQNNETKQDTLKKKGGRTKKWYVLGLTLLVIGLFISYLSLYLIRSDIFSILVYEESVLTPLYDYESMQYMDAREYAEQCSEESWDYGCILNVYLSNKKDIPITVSETAVIIDNIIKNVQSEVYIIGVYSETDNILTLYAINNGLGEFEDGQICIRVNHFKEDNSSRYLTDEEIIYLLEGNSVIEIDNLIGGEIRKIAKYNINKEFLRELDLICISYKILDNNEDQIVKDESIGLMGYVGSEIFLSISEGDYSDIIVERSLSIDVDNDKGRELKIPANFVIEGNYLKNVLYALYPTSSCEVTFHAILKCAGKKCEIETEKFTHKIYVPLYKEDGGDFTSVREFIEEYNIDTYYYNSNPIIQKAINYVPMEKTEEYYYY